MSNPSDRLTPGLWKSITGAAAGLVSGGSSTDATPPANGHANGGSAPQADRGLWGNASQASLSVDEAAKEATRLLQKLNAYLGDEESTNLTWLKGKIVSLIASHDLPDEKKAQLDDALAAFKEGASLGWLRDKILTLGDFQADERRRLDEILDSLEHGASLGETAEQILGIAEIDQTQLIEALQTYGSGAGVAATAKKIWTIVDDSHLILAGVHINAGGVDPQPIAELNAAEAALRALEEPEAPLPEDELTPEATQAKVEATCRKLAELCAMWTVDGLFGHASKDNDLRRWIQQSGAKENYLKQFSFFKRLFARFAFWIVNGFLQQSIRRTVTSVASDVRTFLGDELDMTQFTSEKFKDLAQYYAQINRLAETYGKDPKMPDGSPVGTFESYLEAHLKHFGAGMGEKELIETFREILVGRYVPRPNYSIGPVRIPGLTSLAEWISWKIRKRIVSSYFKRAALIETMITKGVTAVKHAQLELKRLLNTKLAEVHNYLLAQASGQEEETSLEESTLSSMSERTQGMVDQYFKERIQNHSRELLRFIAVEACKGDVRQMRRLDNSPLEFVRNVLSNLGLEGKLPADQIDGALEGAITGLTTHAFTYLSKNRETEMERHLQTLFGLLDKEFEPLPDGHDALFDAQIIQREMEAVNANLQQTMTALARLAAQDSVDRQLSDNMASEKHRKNQDIAKAEIAQIHQMASGVDLEFTADSLTQDLQTAREAVGAYLTHLKKQDLSDCYTDVEGEINRAHQQALSEHLQGAILPALDQLRGYAVGTALLSCLSQENLDTAALRTEGKKLPQPRELTTLIKAYETLRTQVEAPEAQSFLQLAKQEEALKQSIATYDQVMQALLEAAKPDQELGAALEGAAFQTLREAQPEDRKKLIEGSWGRAGLYKQYLAKKTDAQSQLAALNAKLLPLRKRYGQETSAASFEQSQADKARDLETKKEALKAFAEGLQRMDVAGDDPDHDHDDKVDLIASAKARIHSAATALSEFEIEVKGCVTIGEMELKEKAGPQLVGHLSKIISEKMETMVHALGKPFHYKQILLRLILADVVKRNQT